MIKDLKSLSVAEKEYLYSTLNKVSIITNVSVKDITQPGRGFEHVAAARQYYYYLAYTHMPFKVSLAAIGSVTSERDHATVSTGIKRVRTDISLGYIPTLSMLKLYEDLANNVSTYNLKWKMFSLTKSIRENEFLKLEVILEC